MIEIIILFLLGLILFYVLNILCLKNKILIDDVLVSSHKKFINKIEIPITGGILILFSIIFLFKDIILINKILFFLIFLLGLLSDIDKLRSPKIRLFFQFLIVTIYIYFNSTYVTEIRIDYLDENFLNLFLFQLIFSIFCILILINGSNFIDGVNTLNAGYYFIIFLNILFISNSNEIEIGIYNLKILIVILFIFLIHNAFNKSFMGDSGSYLLSFYVAVFFINFSNENELISPYYVAVLLWYPAFENFFSLARRLFFDRRKVNNADNLHLHHLLFIYIRENIVDSKHTNTLTGLTINLFNFIILLFANNYLYQTKILLLILALTLLSYITIYFLLKRNIKY